MWTTYHHDPERSGYDAETGRAIAPVLAWHSGELGAPIWSQPLILGEHVYTATVGDEVYAFEASGGKVLWQKSVGTAVPSGELPCGDITPTVGVVGTPLIDPAAGAIYMVADTWDPSTKEAHHLLKGLSLANGEEVLSIDVDPPGADPKALLQRTALNLDAGNLIFGFGGNNGDCSDYQGTVAAAPTSGGKPRFWQYKPAPPSSSGGAVWAPGGPAVDSAGYVYATTGNPNPEGGKAVTYDYSDSVLQLDPATDFVEDPATDTPAPFGWFAPPNWEEESNNDLDLSSAGAELLPGGLLFQSGKDGIGHLIDEATMNSGAPAVYEHRVCVEEGSGHGSSFGGDAIADGVIYIPCENGVEALAYNQAQRTFTPLWQGPPEAVGPPILAAGTVWSIATGRFDSEGETLYGLDPATGEARYALTLPSLVIDHFASPSAAGGRLFVATGSSITAYRIAEPGVSEPEEPTKEVSKEPAQEQTKEPTKESSSGGASNLPKGDAIGLDHSSPPPRPPSPATLVHDRLHASPNGRVHVTLRCGGSLSCEGSLTLWAKLAGAHGHLVLVKLLSAHFGPSAGSFAVTLKLDRRAQAELRRHKHLLHLRVTVLSRSGRELSMTAVLT